MQVTLSTDSRRVSQQSGDPFDGLDDVALRLRGRLKRRQFLKRACDENRPRPRPETLCGEILTGRLPKIVVDICGPDPVDASIVIDILEQLVTWQFLTASNDGGEPAVVEGDVVRLSLLPLNRNRSVDRDTCTCPFRIVVRPKE